MKTKKLPVSLLTKKGAPKKDRVSASCIEAILTGTSRTGRSNYSKGWRHKSVWTEATVRQLRLLGYDAIGLNDKKGGANGEYVVITRSGEKTSQRQAFIRAWRKEHRMKCYKERVNEPEAIMAAARAAVILVNPSDAADPEYWRSLYRGCGVYRVGWRNGRMTCAIHGGFHNSCPHMVDPDLWHDAVVHVMKEHSDHIVKMDGSGTTFYFRNMEDADKVCNATSIWYVPNLNTGGKHLNITPADAIIETNKIQAKSTC
jgi:hypothetical protein